MKLYVHEEGGEVTNVWTEDVPEDFTDADVRYSVKVWADEGNRLAQKALPFIRVDISYPRRPGVRVYLDEA